MRKLLKLKAVCEQTGLSRSSIYLMMSKKEFPRNISIGSRAVAWSSEDIEHWIESRINLSSIRVDLYGSES
jgi:prophage regulatory protein